MEKLQDLSQSELQAILDNPERVESMALESDEIQNIQLEREMALASNRSLAEHNLDMKPRLESQKELLVERYSQLETLRDLYRDRCSVRDGIAGQVSPEALFSRLQAEGSKTEAESEVLADEFLEGSLLLDSFLERFTALRCLAHKRRVRIEKFQEILHLKNDANAGTVSSSASDSQDPTAKSSPWNPPASTAASTNQSNSTPQSSSYQNALQPTSSSVSGPSGLPYSPYPVAPPNPLPAASAAAAGPSSQFTPYPGGPFTPAGGYSGPRPAFGPPASSACPYPVQPTFPAPSPGSAFGQYNPRNPQSGAAPYPASYSYGGYSYPAGAPYSSAPSPPGRPIYRPGYGVPQPYS